MAEPDEESRGTQRAVQSVEVGGRLLLALADAGSALTLKELSGRAGLTPSRAHPYLVSYGRIGLVEQDPGNGRYALGPAAFRIGISCLHQSEPLRVAGRAAEALTERTGQATAIAVWANFGPTIVRVVEGRRTLHYNMRPGTVMDLFGTATGRAFAAVMPRERIDEALGMIVGPVIGQNPHPGGTAPAALPERIERARADLLAHGLVRTTGQPIPGINAFSAPVWSHDGALALVLTLLGPDAEVTPDWHGPVAEAVRACARDISERLGGRSPAPQRQAPA